MAKSPRMVPGAEARGLVAPRMERPVLTASRPSQTMAATGPEPMSAIHQLCSNGRARIWWVRRRGIQAISPLKKGLSDRSA